MIDSKINIDSFLLSYVSLEFSKFSWLSLQNLLILFLDTIFLLEKISFQTFNL